MSAVADDVMDRMLAQAAMPTGTDGELLDTEDAGIAQGEGPRPMTDDELQAVVAREIEDAESWVDEEIGPIRANLTRYYKGELPEPPGEGRSGFVSRDVHDVVHMLLPSMMRVFWGSERIVEYIPKNPQAVEAAAQASDYALYVVREENPGFDVFYAAIKDALYQKGGFIQYWWDASECVTGERYTGIDVGAVDFMRTQEGVTIQNEVRYPMPGWQPPPPPPAQAGMPPVPPPEPPMVADFELMRRTREGRIRIQAIPPEEAIFARNAKTPQTARFAGRRCFKTVSELVAMGIPWDVALENSGTDETLDDSGEQYARNPWRDDGDQRDDPAMRLVMYYETYIEVDYDGDGIAERRKVCAIGPGKLVVMNEPFDEVPIVDLVADPIPHTILSECPGESVMDIQNVKSQLARLANDSMAQEVNPRTWAVDGQVNIDDLMNSEVGGVVRMRAPGMMGVVPTGNSAQAALAATQYYDGVREDRVGQTKASAGLDADALQSTTKAAVQMTRDAANDRKELIARIIAERGLKPLFKGILRLMVRHQDQPKIVRLRGKFVQVDPRSWDATMDVATNVGLGFGNKEERIQFLSTVVLPAQKEALQVLGPGNPVVSFQNVLNTLTKICEIAGIEAVEPYFGSLPPGWQPQPPPGQQSNPLVEAEKIKAQAKAEVDTQKNAATADFDRDKLVIQTVTAMVEKGLPLEQMQAMAEFVRSQITLSLIHI